MRTVKYTTYWSYVGSNKRQGELVDFVLDIPYLMESTGVIPPLTVLNQVLATGGGSGGMGPGTKWRPFQVDEAEYEELVQALLNLDIGRARELHPYIQFERIIIDEDLKRYTEYLNWLKDSYNKYAKKM